MIHIYKHSSSFHVAKNFSRTLASFALVPSAQTHPLTSNIMVVNTNGDLELYAIHDTPKQAPWSSRGELAIGAGKSYKIIAGFDGNEPPIEPWDIPNHHPPESVARSDRTREDSVIRGRVKHSAAVFPSRNEDIFPVLGSNVDGVPANLAVSRPGKSRTYSPASFRKFHYEHSPGRSTLGSKILPKAGPMDQLAQTDGHSSRAHSSRRSQPHRSLTRSRKQAASNIHQIVEDDISMTIRGRVIRGYGLNNVCAFVIASQEEYSEA